MKTSRDPILQEIHLVREAIAKASGNNLKRIAQAARARQAKGGRKVVRLSPKRVAPRERAS